MNEQEQREAEEPEDLEVSPEDEEQVIGGATRLSDITITKVVDKSSP